MSAIRCCLMLLSSGLSTCSWRIKVMLGYRFCRICVRRHPKVFTCPQSTTLWCQEKYQIWITIKFSQTLLYFLRVQMKCMCSCHTCKKEVSVCNLVLQIQTTCTFQYKLQLWGKHNWYSYVTETCIAFFFCSHFLVNYGVLRNIF